MAFVNEKMTKEEMEEFAARKIQKPNEYKGYILKPSQWTINREENIFMIRAWRGREERLNDYEFLLGWKGTNIFAKLRESWEDKKRNWEFISIKIPCDLEEKSSEIMQSLKDALMAYGFDGDPNDNARNKRAIVQFSNM